MMGKFKVEGDYDEETLDLTNIKVYVDDEFVLEKDRLSLGEVVDEDLKDVIKKQFRN